MILALKIRVETGLIASGKSDAIETVLALRIQKPDFLKKSGFSWVLYNRASGSIAFIIFLKNATQLIIDRNQIFILVVDVESEVINQWIR